MLEKHNNSNIQNNTFVYLSSEDMIAAGVLEMRECISTMKQVFNILEDGDYRMGGEHGNDHGIKITFPINQQYKMPVFHPDYRFCSMPAYLGGDYNIVGIKSYGSSPFNTSKSLPRSFPMLSLFDVNTGMPIAYMSANILSAMRTGAVAALGALTLSKKEPKILSIIGPGNVSRYALEAIITVCNTIEKIKIYGHHDTYENFIKQFDNKNIEFEMCRSIPSVCNDSDIIFCGNTMSQEFENNPSINYSWLKRGALIIAASSLILEDSFLKKEDTILVTDNYGMYEDWGKNKTRPTQRTVSALLGMRFYDAVLDNVITKDSIINISSVISNKLCFHRDPNDVIVFAMGGMAIEDVAWGYICYQNAIENNIGTYLNL